VTPRVVRTRAALRAATDRWRCDRLRIGLVPTMGALHAGHLSLVTAAQAANDRVIVTIFVNPAQFNSPSDLAAYPREEADDLALLAAAGVDLAYLPSPEEVYPPGFATTVRVRGVSDGLCGAFRPGHFEGVATVVAKLLLQTRPDRAYFGEKDYQQLLLVRRLVRDLDIPVEVLGQATVREPDGLAMSSRNDLLSPAERQVASALPRALFLAADDIAGGGDVVRALGRAKEAVLDAGFRAVDYVELRSACDLRPLDGLTEPGRLLAAAWLGATRLVDNVPVTGTRC
jgi:pantoate--beta-alanine ligase